MGWPPHFWPSKPFRTRSPNSHRVRHGSLLCGARSSAAICLWSAGPAVSRSIPSLCSRVPTRWVHRAVSRARSRSPCIAAIGGPPVTSISVAVATELARSAASFPHDFGVGRCPPTPDAHIRCSVPRVQLP